MALLATPSLAGANYMTSSNDERESLSNGAAEFTRRKKWPEILLKELVGGTIFCLKPILVRKSSQASTSSSTTNDNNNNNWGWKIVYTSPASADMLGQKPADLDGKDFFDLVFAPDHPHLYTFFNSLLTPSLAHHSSSATTSTTSSFAQGPGQGTSSQSKLSPSQTTHVRMLSFSGDSPSSSSDTPTSSIRRSTGPTVWELRAHASGLGEEVNPDLASGGMGTVIPGGVEKGKAIWVMGRKVAENNGDSEGSGSSNGNGNGNGGNGQSLEAFLELKLENERLREELRELQQDLDEDYVPTRSSFSDLSPTKPHHHTSIHQQQYGYDPSSPSSSSSSHSSSASSPTRHNPSTSIASASNVNKPTPKTKTPGRPPKDKTLEGAGTEKERKRAKRMSLAAQGEKEGMHVCVTCGRTDSPEWRKGPLGPKTLCNACGLRWAKRNSTQPGRKERKTEVKK